MAAVTPPTSRRRGKKNRMGEGKVTFLKKGCPFLSPPKIFILIESATSALHPAKVEKFIQKNR